MLMVEWNMDDALAVRFEEGREEIQKYVIELIDQGLSREEIKKRIEAYCNKAGGN